MAAPTITWKSHASASDTTGTTITTLDMATVDAGSWSSAKAIRAYFTAAGVTTISSVRFWLYDQSAKLTGTNVTLIDGIKPWEFVGTHQSALSAKNFGVCSATYGTSMPYYPNTSLGGGYTLPTLTTPTYSDYVWVGAKPNVSAQSGYYTSWGYQIGFDY